MDNILLLNNDILKCDDVSQIYFNNFYNNEGKLISSAKINFKCNKEEYLKLSNTKEINIRYFNIINNREIIGKISNISYNNITCYISIIDTYSQPLTKSYKMEIRKIKLKYVFA